MSNLTTTTPNDELLTSTNSFQIQHRIEFRSEVGDLPLRLTVRQDISKRAGMARLGRSIHAFDFEPAGVSTATNSPTASAAAPTATVAAEMKGVTSWEEAVAASESVTNSANERDSIAAGGSTSERVVLVHNRYNGSKQLYVNQALVYHVKKECTDGNMNSWVIPLSFGRVVLRLTSKLMSSSGFAYVMTHGDTDHVLYKGTS